MVHDLVNAGKKCRARVRLCLHFFTVLFFADDNHIDAQLGSASEDEDPEDESLWSSDGERNARQVNRRNVIHLEEEEGDVESDEDEDEESGEEEQFEKR